MKLKFVVFSFLTWCSYANPTASPTVAPTQSPTFECTSSNTCGENEYCAGSDQTCSQTACSSYVDCVGIFQSGRLPHCGDSGFCTDEFSGTCSVGIDCVNKLALSEAGRVSVGQLHQQVTTTNLTVNRQIALESKVELTANNTIANNITYKVTATEKGYLSRAIFDQVNNDATVLDAIKSVLGGPVSDLLEVTHVEGSRRVLQGRRELQDAGEVEVTVTYEVEGDAYDLLPQGSFDSPDFEQALATSLGQSVDNVTVTDVDGSVSITYIVTNEATGDDPLTEENFDALNDLSDDLAIIEATIESQFGINGADLSTASIDKCGSRDCTGRGTCDADTGFCVCDSTDHWGINCETIVSCGVGTNVPKGGVAYCECPYPSSGQRCQTENTCDGCT